MTKPLPCPVCGKLPMIDSNELGETTALCTQYQTEGIDTITYHELVAYGLSEAEGIERWNKLVGKNP